MKIQKRKINLYFVFRVQQVHEKWVNIRTLLQTKLINILNIHTNPDFKFLAECTEWVHQKLVSPISSSTNPLFSLLIKGPTSARPMGTHLTKTAQKTGWIIHH